MILADILWIRNCTELHVGSGSGLGVIDNPVIRHRRNSFPYLPSSSLKGVIKDYHRKKLPKGFGLEYFEAMFGPDTDNGESSASGIGILDAELLMFPVRSLAGIFAWITCPSALQELCYRIKRLEHPCQELEVFLGENSLSKLDEGYALIPQEKADASPLVIENKNRIVLEEYDFRPFTSVCWATFLNKIACLWQDSFIQKEFQQRAIVLSNDMFHYFVTHATPVVPNIRINPETGTTQDGSLRYTEYLPELCLFHSAFTYQAISAKGLTEEEMREVFQGEHPKNLFIQVGGHETLGKGLVSLSFFDQGE